jgi:acetyltransferase
LLLPEEASLRNPVDMIASATADAYREVLTAVLADPGVDSAIAIFVPPIVTKQRDVVDAITTASAGRNGKPVLAVLMGREGLPEGRADLREAGIPAYIFPESAARALAIMARQREWAARPAQLPELLLVDHDRSARLMQEARASGRRLLTGEAPLALLRSYGIPSVPGRVARDAAAAVAIAGEVGYPVALKVASEQIAHKSDIGGVRIGLERADDVRKAFDEILRNASQVVDRDAIDGILVQRMAGPGRELIVGLARDPSFGPLIMFGLGGVLAEALQDVVFRLAPLTRWDAAEMCRSIRGSALLQAFRGAPPVDFRALEDVLLRVSQLGCAFPEIEELDLNPLLVSETGVVAVDARIVLSPPPPPPLVLEKEVSAVARVEASV